MTHLKSFLAQWSVRPVAAGVLVFFPLIVYGLGLEADMGKTLHDRSFVELPKLSAASELEISGENLGSKPGILVIRIEDKWRPGFRDRANEERMLPPGPFRFRLSLAGLRTPSGRLIDPSRLRRLMIFGGDKVIRWRLDQAQVKDEAALIGQAVGWDFGPRHTAVFPGFRKITPQSENLKGGVPVPIRRQGGDALVSDGIQGIETFEAGLENGQWRITIWTEDMGAWQMLPHWMERRIKINGEIIEMRRTDPESWVLGRYLAGSQKEAILDGDAWTLLAGRRGGRVASEIKVTDGRLKIDISGDRPAATHISGILAEPVNVSAGENAVRAARKQRFLDTWRTAEIKPSTSIQTLRVFRDQRGEKLVRAEDHLTLAAAPNTSTGIDIWLSAPAGMDAVKARVAPRGGSWPEGMHVMLRQGLWRFERATASSTMLRVRASHLSPVTGHIRLSTHLPRRLNVRLSLRRGIRPGIYRADLIISSANVERRLPIVFKILDVTLPAVEKHVGVYLEEAPHLTWFGKYHRHRAEAVMCDLMTLREFGLTAVAPPFTLPGSMPNDGHLSVLRRARVAGFKGPVISYTSAKRQVARHGPDQAARNMAQLNKAIEREDQGPVLWSIADEPSNAGGSYKGVRRLAESFRKHAPELSLLGQLNHKTDRAIADLFDVVLANPGFGIDRKDISLIRSLGADAWIYNVTRPRLAAGFYLWRSGASGYLQWHARMPTADPYDPTDGREDDFQMLYPQVVPCQPNPDIHENLLKLSEGVLDLRWLRWLEESAKSERPARTLLKQLTKAIPDTWKGALKVNEEQLDQWRLDIQTLAAQQQNVSQNVN